MARPTHTLLFTAVMTAALGASHPVHATHGQSPETLEIPAPPAVRRVRSEDPTLSDLVRRVTTRSITFRGLVEAIARTDGIVYVEHGRCRGSRACLEWLANAGPNRLLRVVIDPSKTEREAAASIAHELQHARELFEDSTAKSAAEMQGFFMRIGVRRGYSFETHAAIAAGDAVASELDIWARSGQTP